MSDPRYRAIRREDLESTPQWQSMDADLKRDLQVVSRVLPFRSNSYVMAELIDWSQAPDDPMFQVYFLQRDMLAPEHFRTISQLVDSDASPERIRQAANRIRLSLNPNPAGQFTHNLARLGRRTLPGVQHKYRDTVLLFPPSAQTCHAFCSFCFRWPQFVGMKELQFSQRENDDFLAYLREHREVTDVVVTGGDPMIMHASILASYLEPLLAPEFEHVQTIRIGTKSIANWPYRYTQDQDADAVLRLFERVVAAGRHLAIMGHYNHPIELSTPAAREAISRIRATGAQIRMQSPLLRRVNDSADAWASLWSTGARLGIIPYYMFVERDTGPRSYFEVPIVRAWEIFRDAFSRVSGVARTARGPSMSAFPGKIQVDGVVDIRGECAFALSFIQARKPEWVRRPFYARFDRRATWFDELKPAFGEASFFFESASQSDAAEGHVLRLLATG
ncbi:MAG TPA: hypothetical protein VNZ26_02490 [Vicinamibacterales bacterium]|nr:hypothetical protein [Vicinamibacterales bacterium]